MPASKGPNNFTHIQGPGSIGWGCRSINLVCIDISSSLMIRSNTVTNIIVICRDLVYVKGDIMELEQQTVDGKQQASNHRCS